jgi:hypothetical protein
VFTEYDVLRISDLIHLAFPRAAFNGLEGIIGTLLDHGVPVDLVLAKDYTALERAFRAVNKEYVDLFRPRKASKRHGECTALYVAIKRGHADPSVPENWKGCGHEHRPSTALHVVPSRRSERVMRVLLPHFPPTLMY